VAEHALPNGRVVDAQQMQAHLLALFHDDAFLKRPEMAPVRRYLFAGGDARDALDRRRCQLAFRLGSLFEEYAAARAEMVRTWETRACFINPDRALAERGTPDARREEEEYSTYSDDEQRSGRGPQPAKRRGVIHETGSTPRLGCG
jgi:exonuclease V gamma subunit